MDRCDHALKRFRGFHGPVVTCPEGSSTASTQFMRGELQAPGHRGTRIPAVKSPWGQKLRVGILRALTKASCSAIRESCIGAE
jgi:hypothetical protein